MKIAGVVIDGGIRDAPGIRRAGLPVFARNLTSPQGALKDGPGEVNVPVACGGVPVMPGDVIVADANGVTVVPRQGAKEVAQKAQAIAAGEVAKMRAIKSGQLFPDNLDETLQGKGCVIL
jgi:regulator of RNase E activity RraA